MPIISPTAISPHNRRGISWQAYWATLISATVENAAPTHVVLTFPTAQPLLAATDFTITGFTISSASWSDAVLTLVLSVGVSFYEGNLTVTFGKTGETATVINNIASTGTIVWYQSADESTITKNEANLISVWNDKLASGRNLGQSDDNYKPTYTDGDVIYTLSRMNATVPAIIQPTMYYILIKFRSMANEVRVLQALNQIIANSTSAATTPAIRVSAGTYSSNTPVQLNTWHIIKVKFNGANSWLQIDDNDKVTGNFGTGGFNTPLQLGWSVAYPGIGGNTNFREVIIRNIDESDASVAAISAYLEKKK